MDKLGSSLKEAAPEVWGGIECTVNRVGDEFLWQLGPDGSGLSLADLDQVAALGVRALRFPVLWEQHEREEGAGEDWRWADERLTLLSARGVRPIVGLVHHGSGPAFTSLVDPRFPERLAAYAGRVAARFPWVEAWTPVNEPLTTARFSGLYGCWYPHGRDPRSFVRALLAEVRGTVLAMRAIRAVNPTARLVQTEDLGEIFSVPALRDQADHENERRWLSLDLLCGRVDAAHPLWPWLNGAGMTEAEREELRANPCPPDVIGINHYITSDRYLDDDLSKYPPERHGGNGRDVYADTEAVRARPEGVRGPDALLRQAWERFGLPLAVTEVHLACTREEQMRWFVEIWDAARSLRDHGVDVRAVTAWSLFGARDWDSLLTRRANHYEPGVFDRRFHPPRPTALAEMVRALATGGDFRHPVLGSPGWWRRPVRLNPGLAGEKSDSCAELRRSVPSFGSPGLHASHAQGKRSLLLITSANRALSEVFARVCALRGLPYRLLAPEEMNVADAASVCTATAAFRPWAVVDTGGSPIVGAECARRDLPLLAVTVVRVLSKSVQPCRENDEPIPADEGAERALAAERRLRRVCPRALVVRTAEVFDPWSGASFASWALNRLTAGLTVEADDDVIVSPTSAPDLAHVCLDLLIDGENDLWHLVNSGALSRADFARRIARAFGVDEELVVATPTEWRNEALASQHPALLPPLDDALARFVAEVEPAGELV